MRKPIIAANWKMNNTVAQSLALVDEMMPDLQALQGVERVLCPPFTALSAVRERLEGTGILAGAQNLYPQPKGAYTGEISPPMVAELADYVILGHSERRQYFQEDDAFIGRKLQSARDHGLKSILCVGENLEQNDAGRTSQVIERQLTGALADIETLPGLVIAYEPIWAIGTGRAATAEAANAVIGSIRDVLGHLLGSNVAAETRIQYGGSVSPDNFEEFIRQPEIDGALVGGASLVAKSFVQIVRTAANAKSTI